MGNYCNNAKPISLPSKLSFLSFCHWVLNVYAIWASKHQSPINDNSLNYNSYMSTWKKKISPDVVILTQG